MENLPWYVYLLFELTALLTIGIFYKATNNSKSFSILVLSWIVLQTILSLAGFYNIANTTPPRFPLMILPTFIFILILFGTKKGKVFIDGLNIELLTIIHIIRIPVEIVLYCLFIHKAVPELITFEGRNFDVFSGISAPFIYYFVFVKKNVGKSVILIWNFLCLGLLLNVVFNALLSTPTKIQQFGFDQPNIAIGYFPFILLPALIVPLILFSHLVSIRYFIRNKQCTQIT